MNDQTGNKGKTLSVISYMTLMGALIAYVLNQAKKNSLVSFHIRQSIGLQLFGFIISYILKYMLNFSWYVVVAIFVLLFLIGLNGAIHGEYKKIPVVGGLFQKWFKNIG